MWSYYWGWNHLRCHLFSHLVIACPLQPPPLQLLPSYHLSKGSRKGDMVLVQSLFGAGQAKAWLSGSLGCPVVWSRGLSSSSSMPCSSVLLVPMNSSFHWGDCYMVAHSVLLSLCGIVILLSLSQVQPFLLLCHHQPTTLVHGTMHHFEIHDWDLIWIETLAHDSASLMTIINHQPS